jgi:hypothetical protein
MSQKKIDNLGQNEPAKDQSTEHYIKGSIVEYLQSLGINSRDATHEKIGQTTLVFTNKIEPTPKEDDSIYTSIRYLKYKRQNLKD